MADKARTGDVGSRLRGLSPGDPGLLPQDVCVKDNQLCVIPGTTDDDPSSGVLGRNRVALPVSLFDSRFRRDDQALFWTNDITGGGSLAHTSDDSSLGMNVGTANGDHVIHQTKQYFPYQPAQSQFVLSAFLLETAKANLKQCVGMFDSENGVYLRLDGTSDPEFVRLSSVTGSPVEDVVAQSSWNLDTLDGSGGSGLTLDLTKVQMMVIDFLWPGAIRMGFQLNGTVIYAHQFQTLNVLATPPMGRPSLPLRLEIENTGVTASASELKHFVHSVQSEGRDLPLGVIRAVDLGTSSVTITGTKTPVLAVRAKSSDPHVTIQPVALSFLSTNGNEFLWELIIGATLTGASFSAVSSNSLTEFDTAATSLSGGEVVANGYTSSQDGAGAQELRTALVAGTLLDGTREPVVLALTKAGTGNPKCFAAMTYKEL